MKHTCTSRLFWMAPMLLCLQMVCPAQQNIDAVKDTLRTIERQRLQALVNADLRTADLLHASDFELISPDGSVFNKETYLGEIMSGKLDYRIWDPGEMTVRLYGDVAVIRYLDVTWDLTYGNEPVRPKPGRHTNLYERRKGTWQIVWSQASR